jgi:hypothetical protein
MDTKTSLQEWGFTGDGTIMCGMEVSETMPMFDGEIKVTKHVVVVDSPV